MSALRIAWCGLAILLELCLAFAEPGSPTTANQAPQDQLLFAARQYARVYMANLPSFVCTQTTEQFAAGKKGKHWRKGDSLTSQLIWDQGHEQRTLQLVNSRPVSEKAMWRSPLVSEGEFGNILDSVLGDSSKATYSWHGWEKVGEKPVGVFEYRVDQQNSSLRLSLGSVESIVGFHGLFYTDRKTGTIWRITNDAEGFPSVLKTKSISRAVDYDEVRIGSTRYILPVHATVLLDTGNGNIRNELRFDSYRKFGADSHISFSSEEVTRTGSSQQDRQ